MSAEEPENCDHLLKVQNM